MNVKELLIIMSQDEMEFHRKTARQCFNKAWDYLDMKKRDANDEQQMLHLVHASRYHWGFVGTAKNFATGDWQISRVYAELNEPRLALHFAKSALETTQKNNVPERLPSAYEGMARAYAVAKDYRSAKDYIKKARQALEKETEMSAEDKKIYSDQIDETEKLTKQ
jgi:tetratricopeptide (TPR) repeat protein